ncbi:hypothetical protein ACUW02_005195 [Pseudomonas aeruginosa]|jgi:hypothetical protein|uniref:hypothetical protein n=1 Tax=Pseudomonas aeruginosa TaxID=287 RepID=UPI00053DDC1C|nr:hypothetical protein [Pseudomonas aeruginosa]EJM8826093.1 type II restriction endonuclease subunit M [Pseudomonas aeruginosa]EKU8000458.1 type II restriction endonuclease subunit M [Pseudomonas aeruginosa]EKV2964161.1 type II restriction endonuclease subunit M [Pseudomonas aeruginosa]EKV2993601.1 type II restriction endonuclease subunit M [Pseudomonas aeruginosa]EKX8784366.1 type II restriction endonuclease subunit M [Pseudomonas aeruginosa]
MTIFIRLIEAQDKRSALLNAIANVDDKKVFDVDPESFKQIPGSPFAYWVSDKIRALFSKLPIYEGDGRTVKQGLATADDFRFVRTYWEIESSRVASRADEINSERYWVLYPKGGEFSPFYADIPLLVDWFGNGIKYWHNLNTAGGVRSNIWMLNESAKNHFFQAGLTYPRRLHRLAVMPMPEGAIISVRGSGIYGRREDLFRIAGLYSSSAFDFLVKCMLGRFGHPQFDNGTLCKTPVPKNFPQCASALDEPAKRAISIKRTLDTVNEISHAFLLPALLRGRVGEFSISALVSELEGIQEKIDAIAFELYEISEDDQNAIKLGNKEESSLDSSIEADEEADADDLEEESGDNTSDQGNLLSWCVGVGFGRFDLRLATLERSAPPEPDPFDPLPAKSPGMLPDGAAPFHVHEGILVDDQGHPHDLARLVEEVLARVDVAVPEDVRRWLQRDFFPFHLQRYSKSRRKAPIYWPLSTTSCSYTLWVYYPSLTSQTLYTAINDFVEPKLKQVGGDVTVLRNKGSARTRDDEKQFESLQAFELELIELRDTLLKLAPTYKPNHDDGVQISAAPLWPLFRHKPWQKVLKDTWAKLEKGDYDWAHLAMNYWPERVREKCKTDKSLAIAHGLEDLYIEPEAAPKKTRGRKKTGGDE